MNNLEFVNKLIDVAKNYKTLYVMGCFGAPMTASNKTRYINHHEYNRRTKPKKCIEAAASDTFGFDCVNLIKSILWGWNGDKSKTYGGAKYATNGVPDVSADGMIKKCFDVSTDFSHLEIGEAVWCPGHIGIYIGDGLAVECTPAWKNCVQITACNCTKQGYNKRVWTKHGKLPYIAYTEPSQGEFKPEVIKDNTPDDWASEAVKYAVNNGILFGDDTGNYKLHSECTRQEMIVFLYRFYKSIKG